MAQPKAQQEPTMEEILASIRRIIDSGDDARRDTGGRDDGARAFGGQAFAQEPQAPADFSDASDFSAVAGISDEDLENDYWEQNEPVVVSRTGEGLSAPMEAQEPEIPAVHDEPAEPTARQDVYPGSIAEVAEQVNAAAAQVEAPVEVAEMPDPSADMPASGESEISPLISQENERRIGEALQELSAALEQEGKRNIEEIVTQELRPLLSAWLDANMPTIVERMVAQEISRLRKPRHD